MEWTYQKSQERKHGVRRMLTDLLVDGPKPAKDCREAAKAAGFSGAALKRAKRDMGVLSVAVMSTGPVPSQRIAGWLWRLPAGYDAVPFD